MSPATRLLEKRRRMFEVNEQLERQKQQFERQEVLILSVTHFTFGSGMLGFGSSASSGSSSVFF